MKVEIKRLDSELPVPAYAHAGDAGLDLFAAEDCMLRPGARTALPTGIAVSIPEGYAGFVHARSGRALKEGLALVNAPGLIDSGYRGEIKVIVVNLDPSSDIDIKRGDKIAQLVIHPVASPTVDVVEDLSQTVRGEGGFGSSGR